MYHLKADGMQGEKHIICDGIFMVNITRNIWVKLRLRPENTSYRWS